MNARLQTVARAALVVACLAPASVGAQALDRSKRPAPGPAATFKFPKYVTRVLPNGLTIAIVENHELPVVAVRAVFEGGSIIDPPGKEGLFSLVTGMLREGTSSMSADDLTEAFADQGSSVNPQGFTTIVANLDRSLSLMADMVMHPSFPQDALDRQRANNITTVQRLKDSPQFVAQRLFASIVYGGDHPYARSASEASLTSITRDDLVKFHDEYIRPQNVKLIIVGDVTPASVLPRVQRAFGSWGKGGTTVSYEIPAPAAPSKTTIYLFDRPNSPQSVVAMGQIGPSRSVDDFYALDVMNTIFGQVSGSRLNQNLREKHAYTYGANAFWQWRRPPEPSTFIGSSSIVAPKTDSALIEWFRELRGIRGARPVTPTELDFARTNRVAGLPASMESNDQVANAIVTMLQNDLPADYYDRYMARVSAITGDEVARAATKYVEPDNTVVVVVGDRKVIEAGLKAANLGPVVIVDEKGRPVGP